MALDLRLQQKMVQQLVMTPQLQQAIKLLQMSRMELTELVQEELLENPVLEEGPEPRESSSPGGDELASAEVKAHGAELDPKFRYLLDAPEADPDGIPAVFKFARKTREQYVASEKDGKATGWRFVRQRRPVFERRV